MSRGYTIHLCDVNQQADAGSIGVRLGRVCIRRNIPVTFVANGLGVTRATVYKWFTGISVPNEEKTPAIEAFLENIN